MKAKKVVVIPRAQWNRGRGDGGGRLWDRKENSGCAFGHVMLAEGVPKAALDGRCTPSSVVEIGGPAGEVVRAKFAWAVKTLGGGCYAVTASAGSAMLTNDDAVNLDPECPGDEVLRERRLQEIFARHGYELQFVN